MTTLQESLADYLQIRRRLGFEMPQDGRLLEGFVGFLDQADAPRITVELALAVGEAARGRAPAPLVSAALRGTRVRAPPRHDRPYK